MDLDEALSRLLDGDLDPEAADALRQRIATEPLVAARYRALQAMVADLQALPDELPVRTRAARRSWVALSGWACAAALLAWLALAGRAPEVIQTAEATTYEGVFRIEAGDVIVDLAGRAAIAVEPKLPLVRGGGQEDPMHPIVTHGLAAAAGAVVTITLISGTATVIADGEPVPLVAGEVRSFGGPAVPSVRDEPRVSHEGAARVAELEAELDAVREALGQERFAKILMKGQLEAERGVPTEWPVDLDPRLGAVGFPGELERLVAGIPGLSVATTDCEEYPCIAALEYTGEDPEYMRTVGERVGAWAREPLDGKVSLAMSNLEDGEGDAAKRFIVFSAHGEDRGSNVAQRAGRRMEYVGLQLTEGP